LSYRYSQFIRPFLLLGDIFALNISFILSHYLVFDSLTQITDYRNLAFFLFINLAWMLVINLANPYRNLRVFRIAKVVREIYFIIFLHFLLVGAFSYFAYQDFPRDFILVSYLFFLIVLSLQRITYIYFIRAYRKIGFNFRNIVVVGYGELSKELDKVLNVHPEYGFKLLGYFDDDAEGEYILGEIDDLKHYVLVNNVDIVYCCLPHVEYPKVGKLIEFCEENLIKVRMVADFRGFTYKGLELEMYDYIPVLNVTPIPLDDWKNRAVKRAFDIGFSLFVIIFVLSWLTPLLALIICLDSEGPIFFKQKRSGKINSTFYCLKFRTMRVNKDIKQATQDDQRITKIGAFLRKTSLDELPQFFNVLMGDMSVVGPRPHMISHTEQYSRKIERFMARHFVKPGITGLAQAKGYRGETRELNMMKNRVRLDKFYIENWSLLLDIKILFLTFLTLYNEREHAF